MAPNHKLAQRSVNVVLQSHVKHKNHYNSTTRVPRATKLDRMVAHIDEVLLIKFHDHDLSLPQECLWQTSFAE